jgi:uncharacterized protein DUF4440
VDNTELANLRDELLASCEGFNRKDVGAWLDPFHEDAVTYNKGFITLAVVRPMADAILESARSFNVENVDGRIVDNTAILFGDYRFELADGTAETGAFAITYVRTDGAWKALLSHYTPG